MQRFIVSFTLAALATLVAPAQAFAEPSPVLSNAAVYEPHFTYAERGATTIRKTGPLAAELRNKVVVVRIHADWCPACHASQTVYDLIKTKYAERATFVVFDVTNAKTAAASAAQADKLGLRSLYEATKSATSAVSVVDGATAEVVAQVYNDTVIADYEKAIDTALNKVPAK